jgi:hypothetical protein
MTIRVIIRPDYMEIGYAWGDPTKCTRVGLVDSFSWEESDPNVVIDIPFGAPVIQQIKSRYITGTFDILDVPSIMTALYVQHVNVENTLPAIDPATGVRTKIIYFRIGAIDHEGSPATWDFDNVIVKTIGMANLLLEGGNKAVVRVTFIATGVNIIG